MRSGSSLGKTTSVAGALKSDKPKKKGAGMAPEFSRLVYLSAVHCKGLQEYAPYPRPPSPPWEPAPRAVATFARSSIGGYSHGTEYRRRTRGFSRWEPLPRDGDCGLVQHARTHARTTASSRARAQKPGLGPRTLRRADRSTGTPATSRAPVVARACRIRRVGGQVIRQR